MEALLFLFLLGIVILIFTLIVPLGIVTSIASFQFNVLCYYYIFFSWWCKPAQKMIKEFNDYHLYPIYRGLFNYIYMCRRFVIVALVLMSSLPLTMYSEHVEEVHRIKQIEERELREEEERIKKIQKRLSELRMEEINTLQNTLRKNTELSKDNIFKYRYIITRLSVLLSPDFKDGLSKEIENRKVTYTSLYNGDIRFFKSISEIHNTTYEERLQKLIHLTGYEYKDFNELAEYWDGCRDLDVNNWEHVIYLCTIIQDALPEDMKERIHNEIIYGLPKMEYEFQDVDEYYNN